MGTNSPEFLEDQIRECFGRVAYSHKTHEKQADILEQRNSRIKWSQIILSALISTGLITTVLGDYKLPQFLAAICSFALLALNTYTKNNDPGKLIQKHIDAAAALWKIRESYLSLLTDMRAGIINDNEVISQRDQLQQDLYEIYKFSPRTTSHAYKKASEGLKNREELTFTDKEIDDFLPQKLRKNNK